jgi:hypothetical protein
MKGKIVGLCIGMLVLAAAFPAVGSMINQDVTSAKISNTAPTTNQGPNPSPTGGIVIFSQPPHGPSDIWSAYTTSSIFPYLCQEDFWGLTDSIQDIHWWGLTLIWNSGWYPGHPDGMLFEIIFYQDSGGLPGAVVATYSNIAPTVTDTGASYAGYELYYFETDVPAVTLATGWVSIQSTASPDNSALLWMSSPTGNTNALQNGVSLANNLAFELTHKANPDLTCTGSLGWASVKPGDTVTGTFQVGNIGDTGSLLNWQVQSWPTWGTWTFTPASGTGLAQGSYTAVSVSVVAPPDKKTNFTGNVTVVNTDNPSDSYVIPVYLETPLHQGLYRGTFLERFFERFPNAFPILRQLLGL